MGELLRSEGLSTTVRAEAIPVPVWIRLVVGTAEARLESPRGSQPSLGHSKMLRIFPSVLLATAALAAEAQDEAAAALVGTIEAGVYTSPPGAFKIEVPVLPALGGV